MTVKTQFEAASANENDNLNKIIIGPPAADKRIAAQAYIDTLTANDENGAVIAEFFNPHNLSESLRRGSLSVWLKSADIILMDDLCDIATPFKTQVPEIIAEITAAMNNGKVVVLTGNTDTMQKFLQNQQAFASKFGAPTVIAGPAPKPQNGKNVSPAL